MLDCISDEYVSVHRVISVNGHFCPRLIDYCECMVFGPAENFEFYSLFDFYFWILHQSARTCSMAPSYVDQKCIRYLHINYDALPHLPQSKDHPIFIIRGQANICQYVEHFKHRQKMGRAVSRSNILNHLPVYLFIHLYSYKLTCYTFFATTIFEVK